ncbi:MAG: alpha-L-fucosidase [Kiritimatiellae bacterium]|nr:alpha-L-fucosidase [Kiritimatiellia bacterium]
MRRSDIYLKRLERVMKWYAPARFGVFYHWGLFTGGGCSIHGNEESQGSPLAFKTAAEFDAATPAPEVVARNMIDGAVRAGARYAILTALHSGEAECVLFPTRSRSYLYKTQKDYIGAFLDEAHRRGLKAELYFPMGPGDWDAPEAGPSLAEDARDMPGWAAAFRALLAEMKERYGDRIDGFWLDGRMEGDERRALPAYIRSLWPEAIITSNGDGELNIDELDIGTSEEYEDTPSPSYNRPSAYRRNGRWGATPPRRDFNEDIPHVGADLYWWWAGDGTTNKAYIDDRFLLLRQMCCAIGQRGIWNFAPGLTPLIDGSLPDNHLPWLDAIRGFLDWGSEAVFGTKGAEASIMTPGYFDHHNSIGFASITRPFDRDDIFYALVTQAPLKGFALFESAGYVPTRITDLRTGEVLPFEMWGSGPYLEGVDWSDVERFGVKVLKFEFD